MPAEDASVRRVPNRRATNERPAGPKLVSPTRHGQETQGKASVESFDPKHMKRNKRTASPPGNQPAATMRGSGRRDRADSARALSAATESWLGRLGELVDRLSPDAVRVVNDEIMQRMRRIPTQLNEFGYDPWGLNVDVARRALVVTTLLYRHYFRVETHGIENLPRRRVLLIGNHAGQVALDAAMIGTATFLEGNPPRILRGMGEYWLPTLPFVNIMMSRTGSVVGTPKNCVDLLENEEAVVAFPEGVRGMNKLFRDRYRLQQFGYGFMRLALATNTPIVPVAVVGSEEQAPGLANLPSVGRLLGMPAFPITLTWPLLGPLGMIPFPVKYRIYVGKPLRFTGDPDEEDVAIGRRVDQVKDTIQTMLEAGVRARRGIFF